MHRSRYMYDRTWYNCTNFVTHLQKKCYAPTEYIVRLTRKRIALCEKWAMRFLEKACAFF